VPLGVVLVISSPFSLGLSDGELKMVAEIVLNWSASDTMLGYCLGLVRNDAGIPLLPKDQMFEKDISEKVRLMSLLKKGKWLTSDQAGLTKEFLTVYGRWGGDRNIVAHGIAQRALDGHISIYSERKGAGIGPSELPKYLARSRFCLHLIMRLNISLAGVQWDPLGPLPDRPE